MHDVQHCVPHVLMVVMRETKLKECVGSPNITSLPHTAPFGTTPHLCTVVVLRDAQLLLLNLHQLHLKVCHTTLNIWFQKDGIEYTR